jgi:hypothetical protein
VDPGPAMCRLTAIENRKSAGIVPSIGLFELLFIVIIVLVFVGVLIAVLRALRRR